MNGRSPFLNNSILSSLNDVYLWQLLKSKKKLRWYWSITITGYDLTRENMCHGCSVLTCIKNSGEWNFKLKMYDLLWCLIIPVNNEILKSFAQCPVLLIEFSIASVPFANRTNLKIVMVNTDLTQVTLKEGCDTCYGEGWVRRKPHFLATFFCPFNHLIIHAY